MKRTTLSAAATLDQLSIPADGDLNRKEEVGCAKLDPIRPHIKMFWQAQKLARTSLFRLLLGGFYYSSQAV